MPPVPQPYAALQLHHREVSTTRSGPIPDPDEMAKYSALDSSIPATIMAMAVSQANHRHDLEKKAIDADIHVMKCGQVFAFTLGAIGLVGAIICSIVATLHDSTSGNVTGGAIGGVSLISLVTVFLKGSSRRDAEREKKRELMKKA